MGRSTTQVKLSASNQNNKEVNLTTRFYHCSVPCLGLFHIKQRPKLISFSGFHAAPKY
jgi:hypothetical protein